ncbi:uncharacterized protein FIBRA_07306 [Fibroporia radiculosa]|uniref:Uncharacterized protein n=1 Tax=Fibroporia radiculosa TaxID=599839 RepID=J4H4J5_9APHY|nr:uncharacterized protein FIBRA_07306 [Fibroporia radiculosa]CCM05099.1 predicted protein [Fibroporia radiculosa]
MPARDSSDRDPLNAVLRPPIDETPDEKRYRLEQEAEARRISQAIDESIRQDKLQRKKMRVVRLLLLGQSESGKSTTLRQFQRLYTPSAFREERILWHSIIQLNLVRSIHIILDALADVRPHELPSLPPSPSLRPTLSFNPTSSFAPPSLSGSGSPPRVIAPSMRSRSHRTATLYSDSDAETDSTDASALPSHLSALRMRLAPLHHVETLLISRITPPSEERPYLSPQAQQLYDAVGIPAQVGPSHARSSSTGEVFVRPGAAWKHTMRHDADAAETNGHTYGLGNASADTAEEVQQVLFQCQADLIALWRDPTVRAILKKRKIRLEESPGFFLDDLERVTSLKYYPSDDDVLKARLKTVGVSDYRFEMEAGSESGTQWRIIDVGGSRSQRRE